MAQGIVVRCTTLGARKRRNYIGWWFRKCRSVHNRWVLENERNLGSLVQSVA